MSETADFALKKRYCTVLYRTVLNERVCGRELSR